MPNPPTRPSGFEGLPNGTRVIDIIDARVELIAWCAGCGNKTAPDLRRLAGQQGELMPLAKLESRLRCTFCQRKRGQFQVRSTDLARIPGYR